MPSPPRSPPPPHFRPSRPRPAERGPGPSGRRSGQHRLPRREENPLSGHFESRERSPHALGDTAGGDGAGLAEAIRSVPGKPGMCCRLTHRILFLWKPTEFRTAQQAADSKGVLSGRGDTSPEPPPRGRLGTAGPPGREGQACCPPPSQLDSVTGRQLAPRGSHPDTQSSESARDATAFEDLLLPRWPGGFGTAASASPQPWPEAWL